MRLLDLFCGAGGASVGYYRAGFDIVGIDIKPQPNYPFPFILGEVLDVLSRMIQGEKFLASDGHWYGIGDFDIIHASPPCQGYSKSVSKKNRSKHPKLIEPVRTLLIASQRLYIIENVPGAPLINPFVLCGSSFGLGVRRHRLFEANFPVPTIRCQHENYEPKYPCAWNRKNKLRFVAVSGGWQRLPLEVIQTAMGIDWMTYNELSQAVPPAFTEFIGKQLILQVAIVPRN